MEKRKNGKKIPVNPGVIITFEDNKGRVVKLDKSIVTAIRPVDNWVIKGAKWPNPAIEVFFMDIPSYPIGYFRDEVARDTAMSIITNTKKGKVHFPFEVFFKPVGKSEKVLTELFGSPFKTIMEYKIHQLKAMNFDFISTWNANSRCKLNSLQFKELKRGIFPVELNPKKFTVDCIFFFGIESSLKKKLQSNEVSPITFWSHAVNAMQRSYPSTEKGKSARSTAPELEVSVA